jgi:hypothetical protein
VHRPGDAPISAAQLVHNADVAMYHAKRGGRSRIEVFEQSVDLSILVGDQPNRPDQTVGLG